MPTKETGGAWPSEWISLFDRWIQGGFRRLSLGTARDLKLLDHTKDLGIFDLGCSTDVPATNGNDSVAWFESESIPEQRWPRIGCTCFQEKICPRRRAQS